MIKFENNVFWLNTENLSYVFCVKDNGFLKHLYLGSSIPFEKEIAKLSDTYLRIWAVSIDDKLSETYETSEFACDGIGDFRPSSVNIVNERNVEVCAFLFHSYEIKEGIVKTDELPSPRGDESVETLIVKLKDYYSDALLYLYYTVYSKSDIILRRSEVINAGNKSVTIKKLASANIDFRESALDIIYLHGRNGNEKHLGRQAVSHALTVLESRNGISGHSVSPFYILCDKCADEFVGQAYGVQLMYSGNFKAEIINDGTGNIRANIGLNDYKFSYTLGAGEKLESPWAIITYSDNGFNKVSENFNSFTEKYIIPLQFAGKKRPITVNTWDSCVFDVDERKCLQIIEKAKQIGAELFVIDDGWFGRRNPSENDGLGDWYENKTKFPRGLEYISATAKKSGLQFGLWIEPEMVNPESDFCAAHPDWILRYDKKPYLISRHQYILDFSNPEVVEYMTDCICKLIERLELDYIKYDMNRQICEHLSSVTTSGKISYLYMLGVYRFFKTITEKYPKLLIENCSSGGGRYDLGMCAYCPQTWISDNTNPFERARIAYFSTMFLPASTASCHTVGKERWPSSTHKFIFDNAKTRVFGIENDLLKASDDELAILIDEVKEYKKKYSELIFYDFFRLHYTEYELAYICVSKNKKKAILFVSKLKDDANPPYKNIKLYGLSSHLKYESELGTFYGKTLMSAGIPLLEISKAGQTLEISFIAIL